MSTLQYDGSSSRALNTSNHINKADDAIRAVILQCPPGACGPNNTCLQNRTGIMCGVCKPEYSMTTGGCSVRACPSDERLEMLRKIAIGVALTVGLLMCLNRSCEHAYADVEV
jgi:nitrite reductase/ring-hydroxylating ferredoxin subunit